MTRRNAEQGEEVQGDLQADTKMLLMPFPRLGFVALCKNKNAIKGGTKPDGEAQRSVKRAPKGIILMTQQRRWEYQVTMEHICFEYPL